MTSTPAVRSLRPLARISVIGIVATVLFALGAGIASAHVTVNPVDAAAGSYAKLTFRVPTESATASTVAIQVTLPKDHPLPTVSVMPVPGWVVTPTTTPLNPPVTEGKFTLTDATTSVTWAAQDGNGIAPGEFQEFSLSVGPIPDVASLVLPVVQTYSDGTTVEWKDVAPAGVDPHSLDHPAPTVTISTVGAATAGAASATGTASSGSGAAATVAPQSDGAAEILGAVALLVAAAALLVAVLGWRRGRTTRVTSGSPSASGERAAAE